MGGWGREPQGRHGPCGSRPLLRALPGWTRRGPHVLCSDAGSDGHGSACGEGCRVADPRVSRGRGAYRGPEQRLPFNYHHRGGRKTRYLLDANDFRQSVNSRNTSCRVQRSRYTARAWKPYACRVLVHGSRVTTVEAGSRSSDTLTVRKG